MLQTRKQRVILVTKNTEEEIKLSNYEIANGIEIEKLIVDSIIQKHNSFLEK